MLDVAAKNYYQEELVQTKERSIGDAHMHKTWIPIDDRTRLTRKQIAVLFLSQDGLCPLCSMKLHTKGHVPVSFIDEHMLARGIGGSESMDNRALVCIPCAKAKTVADKGAIEKCKRVRDRHIGAKRSRNPMPGSRASGWRKRMDGTAERRT
jgi:5-methylcytosine-specific restriction enzyme A